MSSNPSTLYWMDIFQIPICCKICNVGLKRQKQMKKSPGLAHFLEKCKIRQIMVESLYDTGRLNDFCCTLSWQLSSSLIKMIENNKKIALESGLRKDKLCST